MYVLELHESLFEHQELDAAPSALSGWRLFAPCVEDDFESCSINQIAAEWESRDLGDYIALMIGLCRKASAGVPLESVFDDKKLHEVARIQIRRRGRPASVALWQLRRGNVRLLFFYGEGNRIVVAVHTFVKRVNKTPPGAIDQALGVCQEYFDCLDKKSIQTVKDQGVAHDFLQAHQRNR